MARDKEVSNAFVRIGAKNDDLKRAFAESETVTNASLGRMGRAMQAFGASFAGRIGLPLGVAGAAGAGAGFAGLLKKADETAKQMRLLGIATGESGIDFQETVDIADRFAAVLDKMIGFTRREAREMAVLGVQFGFAGEKLKELMEAGTGLALRVGRDPIEGVRALAETIFTGRNLDDFKVFIRGTGEQVRAAGTEVGKPAFEALKGLGAPLPGSAFDRLKAEMGEAFQSLAEFTEEGVAEGRKKFDRARQFLDSDVDATLFGKATKQLRRVLGPILEGVIALNPFSETGRFVLENFFDPVGPSGQDVSDLISGQREAETGLDAATRFERGPASATNQFLPQATGEPTNFVESVDRNTAAVDRNTTELQRQPESRPP